MDFFRSEIKKLADLGMSPCLSNSCLFALLTASLGIWLSGCWMLSSHSAYAGLGVSRGLFSMKWLGQWLRNGNKQASNATVTVCPKHCGSRKE